MKSKKVKVEPIPKLLKKAQIVFNSYIRLRDEGMPCISCGSDKANQAGHYIAVGHPQGGSYLRFDERNCALQCSYCNKWQYGNPVMYRRELCKRIGALEVERLECDAAENRCHKWDREALYAIIEKYSQLTKAA